MISCCCVCLPLFGKHGYSSDLIFPPDLLGFWDPRGRFLSYLSGKGSSSWSIPTWVGLGHVWNTYLDRFFSVAIPTQVWVPETNTPSWWDCCQLLPGQVQLKNLLSLDVSWDLQDTVWGSKILGACLSDGMLGNAWSNNQPNFGCLTSNNILIVLVPRGTVANGNACPLLLCNFAAHC